MSRTWNQYVVKQENKALVLTTIINHTPISRAAVAQSTGLNKGTVSSLVSELIDEAFVTESGPGASSGGRRPVMLLFNTKAGFTVSVDLGVGYIQAALTDLNGEIVQVEKKQVKESTFDLVFETLVHLIEQLIKHAPVSRYGVIGIGVGVPAVVSHEGEILLAPNLNWKNIQLKQALEDVFDLPILIENEANAGAYGEMRFGFKQPPKDMIYASIGIGIGAGMILDGKLYTGKSGFSGEIGHMTIVKDGTSCRCGNVGCFERYASEQVLLEHAVKRHLIKANEDLSLDTLIKKAEAHDQEVLQLFEEIGEYIGIGLTNIINIFNPEVVLIGNRLRDLQKWLIPPIEHYIHSRAIGFHQQDLTVDFAKLENFSTVKGMAAFTIERFLAQLKDI